MKPLSIVKQDQILDVAIKRFSYYGINKTTLIEIAEDLSVSKQSINYYFTDKQSLITAVARKILTEYLETIEESFYTATNVEEGLIRLIEVKRNFFQKYYQLVFPLDKTDMRITNPELRSLYEEAKQKNVSQIAALLQKGVQQKELKPIDELKTSRLVLETLTAFENGMKDRNAFPELTDFQTLHEMQKDILLIFLNGLKQNTWKN